MSLQPFICPMMDLVKLNLIDQMPEWVIDYEIQASTISKKSYGGFNVFNKVVNL